MAAEDTKAFAAKCGSYLSHGVVSLGIEVGSRLGIFDYMIKRDQPLSSQEIADGLKFKERYVREWLGIVVCGGLVDTSEEKYSIPPHRVPVLSSACPTNAVIHSWLMSMFAGVTNDLMECFKLEGPKGIPYSKYPLFHPWREAFLQSTYTEDEMMAAINLVPGLLEKLEEGIKMADFGCSTGVISFFFAKRFPKTQIYGYDIGEDAIKFASEKAKKLGINNIHFAVQDCCKMPPDWSETFDYVYVYDVVHDVPQSDKFLSEIRRVLKPGCPASIIDVNMHTDVAKNVDIPYAADMYGASLFHCMVVSLNEGGMGLGACWGVEKAQELMAAAGFSTAEVKTLENSFQAIYTCYP